MWVAKIKMEGKNALLGNLAKTCRISIFGYPAHIKESENHLEVDIVGTISGSKENKEKFFNLLKNHPRTLQISMEDNLILGKIIDPLKVSPIYNYGLIHLEPVYITEEGTEYWTLGSLDKESIIQFISSVEDMLGADIISVGQKKIDNFMIMNIRPNFSSQQRLAMDLAVKHGYYSYPRKISVKNLAKLSGTSFSTYQAHLRKAENKFFPFHFHRFCGEDSKTVANVILPEAFPSS